MWPLAACEPVKLPPVMLDELAVQEVALLEDQVSVTACPRLILMACAGVLKATVGDGDPPYAPPALLPMLLLLLP
jgi:hypothetical protein